MNETREDISKRRWRCEASGEGEREEGGPHSEARGKNCTSIEQEDFSANQTEQTATRERRTKGTASAELHGGSVGSESGSGKQGRST